MAILNNVHKGSAWNNDNISQSFQALSGEGQVKKIIYKSASITLGTLADAAGATYSVSVPGVALGDVVLGASLGVDAVDMTITAYVVSANTVEVRVQNESGAQHVLGAQTCRLLIADVT